jgi:hypothetical protein
VGHHQDISLKQGNVVVGTAVKDEPGDGLALPHLGYILKPYDFKPSHDFPKRPAFSKARMMPIFKAVS